MSHIAKADSFAKWAMLMIYIGIAIIVGFLFMMLFSGMLRGGELYIEGATMLGTFIGGTVGAMWALAGVFLYYAALIYQKENMQMALITSKKQIENAEFQKFQYSYFELSKLLEMQGRELPLLDSVDDRVPDKVNVLSLASHLLERLMEDVRSAENVTSVNFSKHHPNRTLYYEKLSTYCETFYILIDECKRLHEVDPHQAQAYERILINGLTPGYINALLLYGLTMPAHEQKLKKYFCESYIWNKKYLDLYWDRRQMIEFWSKVNSDFTLKKYNGLPH